MSTHSLRSVEELVAAGLVAAAEAEALRPVVGHYAVSITPDMAGLIDPNDPDDPIARQFVPTAAEAIASPQELTDPIGDEAHSPVEGVVHRYPDRVLLKLLHACPVYCRFCFRREMVGPGGTQSLSPQALSAALDYIRAHGEIWEVILTGGDPLALSPRRLAEVMKALSTIDHVKVVRVHTRVPAVDPDRISDDLVAALGGFPRAVFVALHANHPRELTVRARAACARLIDAGIPMLSQSVLLKGVNDDPQVLADLMRAFVETRIKPYYLHQADLAPGTAHLRTTIAEGQALMRSLLGRVSGLCRPEYVLDIPGGHGKSPVGPVYLAQDGQAVEDFRGLLHAYDPVAGKPESRD